MDEFQNLYTEQVYKDFSRNLEFLGYWNTDSAITRSELRWDLKDDEGQKLLRIQINMKEDSHESTVKLKICHELGHAYKDKKGMSQLRKEGHADYFASQCLLDYYKKIDEESAELQVVSAIHTFAQESQLDLLKLHTEKLYRLKNQSNIHPQPACRILTMYAGLYQSQIPDCALVLKL